MRNSYEEEDSQILQSFKKPKIVLWTNFLWASIIGTLAIKMTLLGLKWCPLQREKSAKLKSFSRWRF